jgi:light-regulated signal transduction histidine kinase (bacteriophytochrome)
MKNVPVLGIKGWTSSEIVSVAPPTSGVSDEERVLEYAEKLIRRELEQFVYVASHDLQEPLRSITIYAELLSKEVNAKLGAEQGRYLRRILDASGRLKNLMQGLLEFSRLSQEGGGAELIDLNDVLTEALATLGPAIEWTKATVASGHLPTVAIKRRQARMLFEELIGNAIKFHALDPPQIYVIVSRENDHWLFSVRDNGIGIDPRYHERVFVLFQRLHSAEDYPGTGVGLPVCKKIIDLHHGDIWVESEPGNGATVKFTLPVLPKNDRA